MSAENPKATKFIAYLRKSTDDKEKQILSLDSQKDIIERLTKTNNLTIVEIIEEKKSAKKTGRPGFARMLKLIQDKKADGIVTWSPYRLSRNAVDTGEIITYIDENLLKEVITESYTFRKTPMDTFLLGFQCAQAKFENDNRAKDVKAGMEKAARNGIYPTCPPLGYLPDKHGIKGARKREIDLLRFPLVKKMWDLMLTGRYTPHQILKIATNQWAYGVAMVTRLANQ